MIKLTKEQILILHSELIKTTGGSDGIRDIGLLESALETPFQSYGGEELYPSIQAKASRLCYGLVKNPPDQLSVLTNSETETTGRKQTKEPDQSKSWSTVNFTKRKQRKNAGF